MAMSVSSSAVRAALAASILTAWGTEATYFSASHTPLTNTDFTGITDSETAARAYVLLDSAEPEPGEGQAGFSQAQIRFPFRIVGVFKFPEAGSGDVLQDVKETNADALLAVLTASPVYADGRREVTGIRYNDIAATEQLRGHYQIEIDFQWRGTTGR
jgi:hypothetical protein